MGMVIIGAAFLTTVYAPSEEYESASIDVASMPANSHGSVVAQRFTSCQLSKSNVPGNGASIRAAESIWTSTTVSGVSTNWRMTSLFTGSIRVEKHMNSEIAQHARARLLPASRPSQRLAPVPVASSCAAGALESSPDCSVAVAFIYARESAVLGRRERTVETVTEALFRSRELLE